MYVLEDLIYKLNDILGENIKEDRFVKYIICRSTAKVDLGSIIVWQKVPIVDPSHSQVHTLTQNKSEIILLLHAKEHIP